MDLGIYNKQNIIKRDKSEIEILLESLNKTKRRTKPQPVQQTTLFVPAARSGDAVTFELSDQAKQKLKNEEIEATLNSGEPLKNCTLEEFDNYYYNKHGHKCSPEELNCWYRQALKGDNASIEEREWRHNPNYRIPLRIWDSPEVSADREAAIEKYKTGAELEPWEKKVMRTFVNAGIEGDVMREANHVREQNIMQNTIADMLSEAGIELAPDEELTFSVWGRNVEVSGANDEDTNRHVADLFLQRADNKEKYGENVVTGQRMSNFYYAVNRDKQQESGFTGMWLKAAVRHLEDSGTGITVFDLSLDDEGNIVGLPEELDTFIKENAKGELLDNIDAVGEERKTIVQARNMREAFKSAINTINNGEYEKYRNMKCYLTYKNGVLECK